ncbi:MAG: AlwI family type II restriction endonuclease [Clostridia bacterium]|nr:AlwI family type II restriction endonuclease [Clostridia bacterium]
MLSYKSFCWALGTTSFRTENFNKTIEQQLSLLNGFRQLPENQNRQWEANNAMQSRYYDYMKEKGFVDGNASNKPKDAREKTSGLVDIGLITAGRKLTPAGSALLALTEKNDFAPDNLFRISKDGYIYLKQLLKTYNPIDGGFVRPYLILAHLLCEFDTLTMEEFTYLLPLCTAPAYTESVIRGIREIRAGALDADALILSRLMDMENYAQALALFLHTDVCEELICEIGMNRKSRAYDKAYYPLYLALYDFYRNGNPNAVYEIFLATKQINIGTWWRNYLFTTLSAKTIRKEGGKTLRPTAFDTALTESEFKTAFFRIMHLMKAKATLSDYLDLNRRYIKTTDTVLFEDGTVRFDILPRHFFRLIDRELYAYAYQPCALLFEDCPIEAIAPCLAVDEEAVLRAVGDELGISLLTAEDAQRVLEKRRYQRLERLIESKFTDEKLLALLAHFENRADSEIRRAVTDNADVPTIFEYVLGIIWYKISERRGRILDYMKLSLDADLLPKTHAAGGEADIVYEYAATDAYPAHTLLLEATLADSTNQRRMEMEPVSRHLGQHLIRTGNPHSYCVFATTDLNINVISDFRGRKFIPYYDPKDFTKYVTGMKILPLQTSDLKQILSRRMTYRALYPILETAYQSFLPPHLWYPECISAPLAKKETESR